MDKEITPKDPARVEQSGHASSVVVRKSLGNSWRRKSLGNSWRRKSLGNSWR